MSVGSSFDAYVKAYIHLRIFGKNHTDSGRFDFDTIFNKQVDKENRDWALNAGGHCFRAYKECGALGDLMTLLERAAEPPMMEFTAVGTVVEDNGVYKGVSARIVPEEHTVAREDSSAVVILGKPDLMFITEQMIKVIIDWKVNGYCSARGIGPVPGYISILGDPKKHGAAHKDAVPWFEGDMEINSVPNLEEKKKDWALQLSTYAWICGAKVGEDFIVGVDQLSCRPYMPDAPRIATAQHRCNITPGFQRQAYCAFQSLWDTIANGHIFQSVSREESDARCVQLDSQAAAFEGKESKHEWLRQITGRTGR